MAIWWSVHISFNVNYTLISFINHSRTYRSTMQFYLRNICARDTTVVSCTSIAVGPMLNRVATENIGKSSTTRNDWGRIKGRPGTVFFFSLSSRKLIFFSCWLYWYTSLWYVNRERENRTKKKKTMRKRWIINFTRRSNTVPLECGWS